jgi:hypothetical protein
MLYNRAISLPVCERVDVARPYAPEFITYFLGAILDNPTATYVMIPLKVHYIVMGAKGNRPCLYLRMGVHGYEKIA